MEKKQNVVEDALFQIRNLEETLQENAKGILQSTMKEEIRQLVKESLREQDEEEIEPLTGGEAELDSETEFEDDDMDDMEDDDMDDMEDDEMGDVEDDEMEFDVDDEETIDLTSASDEEVLKVFKAMGDEDGIIVKKEGGNIHLKDGDNDYMIQLGESYMDDGQEEDEFEPTDLEETIYEIQMDEEDDLNPEGETIYEIQMDEEYDEMDFETPVRDAIRSHKGRFETPMRDRLRSRMEDNVEDDMSDRFRSRRYRDMEDDMAEGVDPEMMEYNMSNLDLGEEDDMYSSPEMGEGNHMYGNSEMEEEEEVSMSDLNSVMEAVKKAMKPKGIGMGNASKFKYGKKPNMSGGFNEKRKEGPKSVGTGKARFEYKEEHEYGGNSHDYKRKDVKGVEKKTGVVKGHFKDYEGKKSETKESARTLGNGSRNYPERKSIPKMRVRPTNESVSNEVNLLKEKNNEYRQALDIFRTKLNEVATFNSNLAYATRLFTEHSTTKQEKINILRRFDNVDTLKESKSLYRSIKDELSSGSKSEERLTESIERTVNRTASTGSSTNLIESKTYENPQFLRMKDLMTKIK
jgi:hypothetical protein